MLDVADAINGDANLVSEMRWRLKGGDVPCSRSSPTRFAARPQVCSVIIVCVFDEREQYGNLEHLLSGGDLRKARREPRTFNIGAII